MPTGLTIDSGVAALASISEVDSPSHNRLEVKGCDDWVITAYHRLAAHGLMATDEIGVYRLTPRGRHAVLSEGIRLITNDDSTWTHDRIRRLERRRAEIARRSRTPGAFGDGGAAPNKEN